MEEKITIQSKLLGIALSSAAIVWLVYLIVKGIVSIINIF